jgi:hypothetical protein
VRGLTVLPEARDPRPDEDVTAAAATLAILAAAAATITFCWLLSVLVPGALSCTESCLRASAGADAMFRGRTRQA